jgi:hypothetical protein
VTGLEGDYFENSRLLKSAVVTLNFQNISLETYLSGIVVPWAEPVRIYPTLPSLNA